jgi:hypothetical protein
VHEAGQTVSQQALAVTIAPQNLCVLAEQDVELINALWNGEAQSAGPFEKTISWPSHISSKPLVKQLCLEAVLVCGGLKPNGPLQLPTEQPEHAPLH